MNLYRKMSRLSAAAAFAASAVFCGGCSMDVLPDTCHPGRYPVEVVLENGFSTKVSVSDGYTMMWEDGDKVAVMALSGDVRSAKSELVASAADAGKSGASFYGTVEISARPETCLFAYPSAAGFSDDGNVIYSYMDQDGSHTPYLYGCCRYDETTLSCEMKHVGGMIHLSAPSEVVSVTVRGNGGERISSFVCNPMTGETAASVDAEQEFTVQLTGQDSYICMPPVNFSKGFSLICTASDGTRMYKSYSSDGGQDSGFNFEAGRFVEISFEDYVAFEAGVSVSAFHTKDNEGRLDGTSVSVSFVKSGAPDKVMSWGADVYNSDGVLVRALSGQPAGSGLKMDVVDSWDYLPQGGYTIRPYYVLYGQRVDMDGLEFSVPAPEFNVLVNGYTSYDRYLSGDIAGANGCDNSTVYGLSASVGIAQRLLSDPRISSSAEYSYDNAEPVSFDGNSLAIGDLPGQSWSAHRLDVTAVFDGVAVGGSHDFHVTGLPYSAAPPKNTGDNPWRGSGAYSFESGYVQFGKGLGSGYCSIDFYMPGDIPVSVSSKIDAHGAPVNTTTYVDAGGSRILSCTSNSSAFSYKTVTLEDTADATLSAGHPDVVAGTTYGLGGTCGKVYYINVRYR